MNKRSFLKAVLTGCGLGITGRAHSQCLSCNPLPAPAAADALAGTNTVPVLEDMTPQEVHELVLQERSELHPSFVHQEHPTPASIDALSERSRAHVEKIVEQLPDTTAEDYLRKIRNFDADFPTDAWLEEQRMPLLAAVVARLNRVQRNVGHANFNLLDFTEMRYFGRNYAEIGAFEKAELELMEEIFHRDASEYGFFGEKVTPDLNHRIRQQDVVKIQDSGHFLFRGDSYNHFLQIQRDVGDQLQLTSGVRNNVKQIHLFLAKTLQSRGNLSKASRSIAPPGYSFHNVGDFDVGKRGLGEQNFTNDFSRTEEYRRLIRLGYVDIRYKDGNQFGVRFEPWHIKLG